MRFAPPSSRLRRGARRLALTICALILGVGFTSAPPSTVEQPRPAAAVSFVTSAPAAESASDEPAAPPACFPAVAALTAERPVGAVAERAPPASPA
ncbi:hypothetical protein [Dactylosporangium sp. CA-092794]|uniref:hypothetical protein n=1 Tax=Dactylosporangium sp. CA-092794 TaxID=3239929 RepID=UPI003D8F2AB4